MDKALVEIAARLSFYELLLEIQFANTFAYCPEPEAALESFKTDLIDRMRYKAYVRGDVDDDDDSGLMIQARGIELAEHFMEKVSDRSKGIAAQIKETAAAAGESKESKTNQSELLQRVNLAAEEIATKITNNMTDEEVRDFISRALQPVDEKRT